MFKLPNFLKFEGLDIPLNEMIKRVGNYGKPQEDFIMANIAEFQDSKIYEERKVARDYFENNTDIRNKQRFYFDRSGHKVIDNTVSNVKLRHAIYRKLVNQKVNYLLSRPFTIHANDKSVEELLKKYFNHNFLSQLQNTVRHSVITGISWMQIYYDSEGNLKFKRIPEYEIIPFWADADHTVLDAVIRIYEILEYKPNADKQIHKKVEYYTSEGVWYYELQENELIPDPDSPKFIDGHYLISRNSVKNGLTELDENGKPIKIEVPQLWEKIPFVCIKYNTQELPLLRFIKDLLDDYDFITSDTSDSIHDIPLNVRVVKNYDGTDKDEFINNLKQLKLAFVSEEGDMTNLDIPLELEGIELHLKRLRKDIYENGCGVDTQDENMRDTSGEALKFRYIDLSLDCQDLGVQISNALQQLAYFIFADAKQFKSATFETTEFNIVFNADMITNESQSILDCKNSVGIVSNETILNHHPYVDDVKQELERLKIQQEEEQKQQLEFEKQMNSYGSNTNGGVLNE